MTLPQKVKVALAGLGRMGKKHAMNIRNLSTKIEFVAAFSITPSELLWAKEHLEPYGVLLYDDYEQMMYHPGLQAVVIATAAAVHKPEVLRAIDLGLHVLCEKPLSTDLASCHEILAASQANPHLKVICGFPRRFDASYREAFRKVQQGLIGSPTIMRSQTCDKHDVSGFFVQYSATSGGIFVDMAIHDIDLSLWFFGPEIQPKCVTAHGVATLHPELLQTNDRDNAVGIVEYWSGQIAYFYVSRMMAHGSEDATEFIGTEGKVSVNVHPAKDLVTLYHPGGILREAADTFWDRFQHAFNTEVSDFADICMERKEIPMRLETAVKALDVAAALQESLISGQQTHFDRDGKRVESRLLKL